MQLHISVRSNSLTDKWDVTVKKVVCLFFYVPGLMPSEFSNAAESCGQSVVVFAKKI